MKYQGFTWEPENHLIDPIGYYDPRFKQIQMS